MLAAIPQAAVYGSVAPAAPVDGHAGASWSGDDGQEPLANLVRGLRREMASDGVLVTWHREDNAPVCMFADGDCERDPAVARDAAARAVRAHAGANDPTTRWQEPEACAGAILTANIPTEGGVVTITSWFRRIGRATRVHAAETVLRLLPLVQPFFRLWAQRQRMLTHVSGLTAAVDHSDVGILFVDQGGRLMFANPAAETVLAQKDGLRRSGAMLAGTKLADTLRLQASIEDAINGDGRRAGASARLPVVVLSRRSNRPLLAAIVPMQEQSRASGCAAIIYVLNPDQDLHPLLEPVCRFYGLSPVEAKLTCLLADGISLGDAAVKMRVREQTARSYLKQIFLKTETNRQAELVWLMLKSAVRAAPPIRA